MPLKRKHLDVLKIANIPYVEEITKDIPHFIGVEKNYIVEVIELLHKTYPEDIPIIPLKIDDYDKYLIYIHDN